MNDMAKVNQHQFDMPIPREMTQAQTKQEHFLNNPGSTRQLKQTQVEMTYVYTHK